jgi:hypothetical protein
MRAFPGEGANYTTGVAQPAATNQGFARQPSIEFLYRHAGAARAHRKRQRNQDQREQDLQAECLLVLERGSQPVERIKQLIPDALHSGSSLIGACHG